MSIDRAVLAFAGLMVLLSLGLSQLHNPNWLWLTAFVAQPCEGHGGMTIGLEAHQSASPTQLAWSLKLPFGAK